MLPQYSGGLGILAGDHLKAASDLGVPIVGVGLLYRHGYFRQSLSREGWQQETYPVLDPDGLPLSLLREADGTRRQDRRSACPASQTLTARIWVAQVGRVPLLLLDSDVEENTEATPRRHRPAVRRQHRAPAAPGDAARHRRRPRAPRVHAGSPAPPAPEVFHTNEGHAGFLGLERIRELTEDTGLDFDAALEVSRAGTVFTTHTPVPAGIDRFPRDLIEQYFGGDNACARRPGRPDPGARRRGLRGRRPGDVQHGGDGLPARPARQRRLPAARRGQPRHVRRAVAGVRRGRGADHLDHQRRARARPGWPARSSTSPAATACGPARPRRRRPDLVFDVVDKVPGKEIWATKRMLRQRLVDDARARLRKSLAAARRRAGRARAGSTRRSTPTC